MHWQRDGTRQRSRILYVFRTPGGVRVGRESLGADVLRQIETEHPDIAFDWKTVLANQQVVDSAPEPRRPRKRKLPGEEAEAQTAVARKEEPAAAPPARPAIPSALQGATPDEQIAFLNQWYPIVRERIPQRTSDPARLEALMALAERLNPVMWTDADQIADGLLSASEALARLSRVFSRRRRRRRPAKTSTNPASPEQPPPRDT